MMMLLCWVVFPAILLAICLGAGLLVERLGGARIPSLLLAPVGAAAVVVAAQLATASDATAELATPLCVALGIAGLLAGRLRHRGDLDPYAAAAAVGVFAVFGAPVILSGEPTFTGYIKLDDTATWFALTDRVMEHGRSLDGLAPSTYEATVSLNLAKGYPVGALLPLGVGRELVGQDVAWVFQPYLAFLAAMLALALATMLSRAVSSARARALAAFVAAQPALLVGYAAWGGVKELVAAALIALLAALAPALLRREGVRAALPIAVCVAALISALSLTGAAVWALPALAPFAVATVRAGGAALRRWVVLAGLTGLLAAPWILGAGVLRPTSSSLTSATVRGNLIEPLSPLQAFGVWPVGDFRVTPDPDVGAAALVAVVAVAGVAGLLYAWRARAWGTVVYAATAACGAGAIFAVGSPWVAGKALAIASPALLLLATAGITIGWRRHRALAALAGTVVFGGVLWSNLLAFGEVNLAPRDRLVELERIGDRIAGEGPTLMTEFEPYGVRHFLRGADPEGAAELRRRTVALRDGGALPKTEFAELDRFDPQAILIYRTLVLRRSPTESRPPAPFELVHEGGFYEVWQQPVPGGSEVLGHAALGGELSPNGRAGCGRVRELAKRADPDGRIVASTVPEPVIEPLEAWSLPPDWKSAPADPFASAAAEGTATARLSVPRSGRYSVWLGGAPRGEATATVAGKRLGPVRHELSYPGHYLDLGSVRLDAGTHRVELDYDAGGWRPGAHGPAFGVGPVALVAEADEPELISVRARRAGSLCGQRLDWVEAIAP